MAKNPPASAGDAGSMPGSGRSPREGNGNPLQYSCLENSMDRGAWWVTVHEVRHDSDGACTLKKKKKKMEGRKGEKENRKKADRKKERKGGRKEERRKGERKDRRKERKWST